MRKVLVPVLMLSLLTLSCEKEENTNDPQQGACQLVESVKTVTGGLIGDEVNTTLFYYNNDDKVVQTVESISGAANADRTTDFLYEGELLKEITVSWSHVENPQYYSFSYDGNQPDTFFYSNDFGDKGYMLLSYTGNKLNKAEYWFKDSYDDVYELDWSEEIEWEGNKVVRSSSYDELFNGIVTSNYEYDENPVPIPMYSMAYIAKDFSFLTPYNVTRTYLTFNGNTILETVFTYIYNDEGYPLSRSIELVGTTNVTDFQYNCN